MKLFRFGFLLGIVLVILAGLMACGVTMANAQEATAEPAPSINSPTGETVLTTPADDILIQADTPGPELGEALAPILVIGSAIAGIMEAYVKPTVRAMIPDTTSGLYRMVVWTLAFALAFIFMLGTRSTVNLLTVMGFFSDAPPLVAQIITAAAIGFGNGFIHVVYDFFGKARLPVTNGSAASAARG